MSSFTSPLMVTPLEDGKNWRLDRPFTYHIGSKYSNTWVNVPKNFVTDFASIPKLLTIFLPDWAKYQKSSVLHDRMYHKHYIKLDGLVHYIQRKQVDDIFQEAMLIEFREHRSGKFIAKIEYLAVRWFAKFAWR